MTTAHNSLANHYLTLSIDSGSIRIDLNYGEGHMDNVVNIGHALNDDQWHTVKVERKGLSLEVSLDNDPKHSIQLIGQHRTLIMSAIHVGAWFNPPQNQCKLSKQFVLVLTGSTQITNIPKALLEACKISFLTVNTILKRLVMAKWQVDKSG